MFPTVQNFSILDLLRVSYEFSKNTQKLKILGLFKRKPRGKLFTRIRPVLGRIVGRICVGIWKKGAWSLPPIRPKPGRIVTWPLWFQLRSFILKFISRTCRAPFFIRKINWFKKWIFDSILVEKWIFDFKKNMKKHGSKWDMKMRRFEPKYSLTRVFWNKNRSCHLV